MSTTRRARERILREAEISPNATKYQLLQATVGFAVTVVGIPLLVVVLPIVQWYYTRYYDHLRVILTNRDLKVHRGILVKEEKTIPLEKITDLRVFEGPIMRRMGLKGIAVETAGQTNQAGALVSVVGILDVDGFRDDVLDQRDRISDPDDEPVGAVAGGAAAAGAGALEASSGAPAGGFGTAGAGGGPAKGLGSAADAAVLETLGDIRDTLRRMEAHLAQRAEGD